MLPADVDSESKRMLAQDLSDIVGELGVPRNGRSNPVRSCPIEVTVPSAKSKVGKASAVGCEAVFTG